MAGVIIPMNVLQQGGLNIPYASRWNDIKKSTSTASAYDLAAARTAMGLGAKESLFLILSGDGGFWCNFYGTAVLPTADILDGTGSIYSPSQRYLDQTITSISFISSATQYISLQFYRP